MIIAPFFVKSKPNKCPKCNKPEQIKEACSHCNYEYKDETTLLEAIIGLSKCVIVLYIIITIIYWLSVNECGQDIWSTTRCSLLDVVKNQWDWLKGIKII